MPRFLVPPQIVELDSAEEGKFLAEMRQNKVEIRPILNDATYHASMSRLKLFENPEPMWNLIGKLRTFRQSKPSLEDLAKDAEEARYIYRSETE